MQSLRRSYQQIKSTIVLSSQVNSYGHSRYIDRISTPIASYQLNRSTNCSTHHQFDIPSFLTTSKRYLITGMPSSISELNFVPGIRIPHVPRIPVGDDKSVDGNNTYYFPVNRIYCVGKNYSDHVKEMGGNPRDEAPCFFMKPSNAVVPCGRSISNDENSSVTQIEYPLGTDNLHYEVELVVAIGNTENGTNDGVTNVSVDDASKLIYGYGVGVDLTRRDLQSQAKKNGLPWCTSKGFDASAPISNIYPITIPQVYEQLHLPLIRSRIDDNEKPQKKEKATDLWLYVNGQLKQSGCPVHEMIWSVPEIISQLSRLYRLRSGDIIFTGTPAGVSRIIPNDTVRAGMNVLGVMEFVLLPNSHPVVTGSSTTVPGTL